MRLRLRDHVTPARNGRSGHAIAAAVLALSAAPPSVAATSAVDGVVSPGEYRFETSESDGDWHLYWRIDGRFVTFAVSARTTGWIAVGFDPSTGMKDADMVLGWVAADGSATVRDSFSVGEAGPHYGDTDPHLDCSDDLLAAAGTESGDWTTIEFRRALDTGDRCDKRIPERGTLEVIWAQGPTDDPSISHDRNLRGRLEVWMTTGGSIDEPPEYHPWQLHALVILTGFALVLGAIVCSAFLRKRRWWLAAHRNIGWLGTSTMFAGFLVGIVMMVVETEPHFRFGHGWYGAATIVALLPTPIMGRVMLRLSARQARRLRVVHRALGWAATGLAAGTILTGLRLVGIV